MKPDILLKIKLETNDFRNDCEGSVSLKLLLGKLKIEAQITAPESWSKENCDLHMFGKAFKKHNLLAVSQLESIDILHQILQPQV